MATAWVPGDQKVYKRCIVGQLCMNYSKKLPGGKFAPSPQYKLELTAQIKHLDWYHISET